jgi:hypothetical protein
MLHWISLLEKEDNMKWIYDVFSILRLAAPPMISLIKTKACLIRLAACFILIALEHRNIYTHAVANASINQQG